MSSAPSPDASRYREQLYGLFADPGRSFESKVDRALSIGSTYLGMPIAFRTRIDGGVQEIVQASGDHPLIQLGETCPLDRAYCRRTVESESPLAVQDAGRSTAISARAIETFDFGAYIGARVVVDDAIQGTVCFAAGPERDAAFSESETYFVELLARLVGQALERHQYERQLAAREAELHERREIYRAVIDASFDLVFRVDDAGRFSYLSPPIEGLLGYPPDQYLGDPFTEMLPDEGTIQLAGEIYEAVLAGETVEEYFFPLEHRSGGHVYVDLRVTPIYDSAGAAADRSAADIVGVQGMASDATDRYRSERLIRVLNRVLRHNLRNDMNVIGGYAELLQQELTGDPASMATVIAETSDGLVALSETARQLERNLSRPATVEPTDIVPLVTEVATDVGRRHPDASIDVEAPASAIANGAPRLETAIEELVDNAAKHGGTPPVVEVAIEPTDRQVVVRVSDDGPGLPDQERDVLEAGDETPLVHASGLGLWLVHWIVESLDGQLRLLERESGTAIEVRLPRPDTG